MKILIIHTAFIGDIVLSTPMITKISEKYKDAKIYYLTIPSGEAILRNNPYLTEVLVYDKRGKQKSWKDFWKLAKKLQKEKFDIVYCPHRYLRSMLLGLMTKAKEKVAYQNAPLSFLYTHRIPYQKDIHEVERLLSFVDGEKTTRYEIGLYPSEKEYRFWDKIKQEVGEKTTIAIAPGSRWATKRWPLEYFQKIITELSSKNLAIILIGGKDEKNLELSYSSSVWDLRGETSLMQLTAILQNVDYVLTNDSSPIHIASSSSHAKIIALFGPTVKSFGFTPWSKNSIVLETEGLECRPCGLHGGEHCPQEHFRCMKEIYPQKVLEEILK